MEYLLDTNVVSELTKRQPNPNVTAWMQASPSSYLSVLTLGEFERGILRLRPRDPVRATRLTAWLTGLRRDYADRLLSVDANVAAHWAALPTSRTLPVIDSLLAATALAHGLTVATRNTADFSATGVATFNPFSPTPPQRTSNNDA